MAEFLDKTGLSYFWEKINQLKQDKLVSGTNIKTVNNQTLLGSGNISAGSVLDFYPVGSYYETSDSTFNPNTAWGGTWELETEGQVHVSAGSNYPVSGALNNSSDGGSKYIQAHTHSHSLTLPNHTHGTGNTTHNRFITQTSNGDGIKRRTIKNGTSTSYEGMMYSENVFSRLATTGNPSSLPSVGGSIGAVSGATTGNEGNMPPYIIVRRWHRTA